MSGLTSYIYHLIMFIIVVIMRFSRAYMTHLTHNMYYTQSTFLYYRLEFFRHKGSVKRVSM